MKVDCFPLPVAIAAVIAVLVVSGCIQTGQITGQVISIDTGDEGTNQTPVRKCPASCSDGNPCTTDFCSEQTGFKCRNIPLSGKPCGDHSLCKDGVCEENKDNCSFIYDIEIISGAVKEEEAESCYQSTYIDPAKAESDPEICNEIVKPSFVGKCYAAIALDMNELDVCDDADEVSARDECYFTYASSMAKLFIFADEACDRINDQEKKEECMKLEDIVTAPVGIKSFYARIRGDEIHSYIILKDIKGRTVVADGTLTVYIKQEDVHGKEDKRLYSKRVDVKRGDFKLTPLSGFGEEDIAYVIEAVKAEDFEELPTENYGTFFVTFYTADGKAFFASEDLEF